MSKVRSGRLFSAALQQCKSVKLFLLIEPQRHRLYGEQWSILDATSGKTVATYWPRHQTLALRGSFINKILWWDAFRAIQLSREST